MMLPTKPYLDLDLNQSCMRTLCRQTGFCDKNRDATDGSCSGHVFHSVKVLPNPCSELRSRVLTTQTAQLRYSEIYSNVQL